MDNYALERRILTIKIITLLRNAVTIYYGVCLQSFQTENKLKGKN
jgi:hypothetical protein